MAGTSNPSGANSGTADSVNQSANAASNLPATDATVGTTSTNGSGVPSQQDIISAFWRRYQAAEQAVANGPDDPNYYTAQDELKVLAPQLSKMSDAQQALDAKKEATGTKPVPSGDQPFPGGWTDENGRHVDGTWGQYATWEKVTNDKLTTATKQANSDLAALKAQYANDIATGKAQAAQAQADYTNMLNTYKAQLSPMVAALSSARDIADMTMRGPVIPAMLQNMAPKGTNAAMVNMINHTPGVTPIPASSGLGQDAPLPYDVNTMGTQIAQNALKTLGPWAQNAAAQAGGGNLGQGNAAAGAANTTTTTAAKPAIPNSQPQQPYYMAPNATQPGAVLPGSQPQNNPGIANPMGTLIGPQGSSVTGRPMVGGQYTAGVDPFTSIPFGQMH